jgi:hypothetical protein
MVVARRHLVGDLRLGALVCSFVGKYIMMRECCESLVAARVASRCKSDLSIESCLAALSTASGEGFSGMESQSRLSMVRQWGAID